MSSDGHLVACLTTCIQLLSWSSYTKVAVSCMQWDTCAMGHLFANISHNVWILDFDAFVLPQRICIAQRMRSCSCSWLWNLRSREDLRVESMSEHCRYLVCATSSLPEGAGAACWSLLHVCVAGGWPSGKFRSESPRQEILPTGECVLENVV